MEIQNDKAFKKVFINRNRSEHTVKKYVSNLKKYCNFTGLTPTELIKEAKNEQVSYLNEKNQIIEPDIEESKLAERLFNFHCYEKRRGMKPSSLRTTMTTIRAFYNANKVKELPDPIEIDEDVETTLNVMKHEKVKRAVDGADLKNQALFTFMASTGMRSGDVRRLTIHDFMSALDFEELDDLLNNEKKDLLGY